MYIATTVSHPDKKKKIKNTTETRFKAISPITLKKHFPNILWTLSNCLCGITNIQIITSSPQKKKERKKVRRKERKNKAWHQTLYTVNMCVTVKTLAKQNAV